MAVREALDRVEEEDITDEDIDNEIAKIRALRAQWATGKKVKKEEEKVDIASLGIELPKPKISERSPNRRF
jgi:FKBP-type peptidyl-prolyl cis-trans isomerase (trigger factor)